MAMGRHMDAVVVDKESVGFECLQYLRDQHQGVVPVLPLATQRPSAHSAHDERTSGRLLPSPVCA